MLLTIYSADISEAFKEIRSPIFPLVDPIEKTLKRLPRYRLSLIDSSEYLPKSFAALSDGISDQPIMKTVQYLNLVTRSYEDYMWKSPTASKLETICLATNICTHTLLSYYPSLQTTTPSPSIDSAIDCTDEELDAPNSLLYATIRNASLIYNVHVLWLMPRSTGIHFQLSMLLLQNLTELEDTGGWNVYPKISIWAALLGSVAGLGKTRWRFLDICRTCLGNIGGKSGREIAAYAGNDWWQQVLDICRSFLWYDGSESPLQQELAQLRNEVDEQMTMK